MVECEDDIFKFQKLLNILTGSTCSEAENELWEDKMPPDTHP
jgi:hypothetical protein